jgi:hypothetical protein
MLVMMEAHATREQVEAVCRRIEEMGYRAHPIPGAMRTAIGITGNRGPIEAAPLEEGRCDIKKPTHRYHSGTNLRNKGVGVSRFIRVLTYEGTK